MDQKNSAFVEKLTEVSGKIADNRYISAISKGISSLIPFTMITAIFTIIANPPVTADLMAKGGLWTLLTPWYNFATTYKSILTVPSSLISALFALLANYNIAYQLATYYKQNAKVSSMLSVVGFVLVAAPLENGALTTLYLGTQGLFVGIILAIVAVEIVHLCEAKNNVIKLPKEVPPIVASSFSAIIPLLLTVVLFYGLSLIVNSTTGLTLPAAIMKLITPAITTVNSVPVMLLIGILCQVLWVLGIHGGAIAWAVVGAMLMQTVATNGELVAAGKAAEFSPALLYSFVSCGGSGCVMSLIFLCCRSKSKQLKAVGKASLIPGLCSITEPITFGAPIIYNPLLAIPFILVPFVNSILGYILYQTGILPIPYIGMWSLMPVGVGEFLRTMSFRSFLIAWLMVALGVVIYYPFFKAYEKQLVKQEAESEK